MSRCYRKNHDILLKILQKKWTLEVALRGIKKQTEHKALNGDSADFI